MIQEGERLRKQLEKHKKEAEERAKAEKKAKGENVDMTAMESVKADFKIQTVPIEKKVVVDDAK
jgi:hypothetical protein